MTDGATDVRLEPSEKFADASRVAVAIVRCGVPAALAEAYCDALVRAATVCVHLPRPGDEAAFMAEMTAAGLRVAFLEPLIVPPAV